MAVDIQQTTLITDLSSLKLLKSGTGTLTVPGLGGAGVSWGVADIPHDYGSSELLAQVSSSSGYVAGTILPWFSNDGRFTQFFRINGTHLQIRCRMQDSGGFGFPSFNVDYSYRIYIP